jgi:hypothetical protein
MDYLQSIIEDFKDKSTFSNWDTLSRRMAPHESRTLVHPNSMTKEQISEMIPQRFNVEETLNLLPAKQKEIARRLDISQLPRDRPPGLLGQAALFEVLRDNGFDFKSYLDNFYRNWDYGGPKANALLFLLGWNARIFISFIGMCSEQELLDCTYLFYQTKKSDTFSMETLLFSFHTYEDSTAASSEPRTC